MKSTTLRLPDDLHASLCTEAEKHGLSLNVLIRLKLAGARFDNQIGVTSTTSTPAPSAPAQTPAPAYVPPVAGKQPDAYILDHLFDDEDPPPYDETAGLKLTTDE